MFITKRSNGMSSKFSIIVKLKNSVKRLKQNIYVLYLANKDPRIPWYVKLFVICVIAYAFSPIDLIPDFIPILGYLDDLIIVPLCIKLALKMIPPSIIEEYRSKAEEMRKNSKPKNWAVGTIIIAIWTITAVWVSVFVYLKIQG
jgi:uncharacterized membrane protein YkvA (DUF1232 family)